MTYVDGFVVPVPKRKLGAYRKLARQSGKIFREYGALEFHECAGDDVPYGKRTSFPRSVKLKLNEIVVLAWITYRSRAHRDRVNARVMKDKRVNAMISKGDFPFDTKRMIFGGFKTIVSYG